MHREYFKKEWRNALKAGVEIYVDDILVWGKTKQEHDFRLMQVLNRAQQINVKFNKDKCRFGLNQIKYLRHHKCKWH